MINHVWGIRSMHELSERRVMVSFDFLNAFLTLSHSFVQAVMQLIELPVGYVMFVLATLRAPYQFCAGRCVVREVSYLPKVGIGQGAPFSHIFFSFCVSFILHLLFAVQGLTSFMYAVDVCSIIEGVNLVHTLSRVQVAMKIFAKFSGWIVSLIKCGVLTKGKLTRTKQSKMEPIADKKLVLGIPFVNSVKNLGVQMGNVSSDMAFAVPFGEAQRRASCITAYGLSM